MGEVTARTLLAAAEDGTGVGGFFVILLLAIASIGLFVLLSGSLRRMRANVASGEFGTPRAGRASAEDNTGTQPEHTTPAVGGQPTGAAGSAGSEAGSSGSDSADVRGS